MSTGTQSKHPLYHLKTNSIQLCRGMQPSKGRSRTIPQPQEVILCLIYVHHYKPINILSRKVQFVNPKLSLFDQCAVNVILVGDEVCFYEGINKQHGLTPTICLLTSYCSARNNKLQCVQTLAHEMCTTWSAWITDEILLYRKVNSLHCAS